MSSSVKKRLRLTLVCLSLLMVLLLITGCGTKPNEADMERALEIVKQVPFPDRYSQRDGTKLVPQDIKVEVSDYNLYDGTQYYQFTCEYINPEVSWFWRGDSRNRAEVILIRDGKEWHSSNILEKEIGACRWK